MKKYYDGDRIYFGAWGIRPGRFRNRIPSYAIYREELGLMGSVAKAIERKTGYEVINASHQGGTFNRENEPTAIHYQVTLGRRLSRRSGGGHSVDGEMWLSIPTR